jgi:hypothetical protein
MRISTGGGNGISGEGGDIYLTPYHNVGGGTINRFIHCGGNLIASVTADVGSSGNHWNNGHFNNLFSNNIISYSGSFQIGGHLIRAAGNFDLGSSSVYWRTLYAQNLRISDSTQVALGTTSSRIVYSTAGGYGTLGTLSSSKRFKTNIESLKDCSWIYKLTPVKFDWKNKKQREAEGKRIGLIAEEVEPLCKELVWYDNEGRVEGVHYEWLAVPMLLEMQKMRMELDAMKKKLGYIGVFV